MNNFLINMLAFYTLLSAVSSELVWLLNCIKNLFFLIIGFILEIYNFQNKEKYTKKNKVLNLKEKKK